MKKPTRWGLIAITVLTLTGVFFALGFFLVATNTGSRWFVTTLSSLGGIKVSSQRIDGRLIDHLRLSKVQLSLSSQQKIEIGTVELRWKPLLLFTGRLDVQNLTVHGVQIQDDSPSDNSPPNLSWPRLFPFAFLFDCKIRQLKLTDLHYKDHLNPTSEVSTVTASTTWQDGRLSISNLKVVFPSGQISGSIKAGFRPPSLTSTLAFIPSQPVAGMDRFSLHLQPTHVRGQEQLAEALVLAGSADKRKLLDLRGEVGMTSSGFNLHRLHLTGPGRQGPATVDGSLVFTGTEPVLNLKGKFAGLDLTPELNIPTNLSGMFSVSGTQERYHGDFSLNNQVHGWQAAVVSASFHGTANGLQLSSLTGSALAGNLFGNLNIDWRDGMALSGAIKGRNLNPAGIAPGYEGMVSFDAEGKVDWPIHAPMRGSVRATLLNSRLSGQPLSGEMQADLADNFLSGIRLALQGKGFNLQAAGGIKQGVKLSARFSDLSHLVPGASGSLRAAGWLHYSDKGLTGCSLAGKGSKLAYLGSQIRSASLRVHSDRGGGRPLHITASLEDLAYGEYLLHNVTVQADGTLAHHTVDISLAAPRATAQLKLDAGFTNNIWKGEINRLSGKDESGAWRLSAPSTFSIGSGKVFLSPLTLTAGAEDRIEMAADIALDPLIGKVQAAWHDFDLSRVSPYLNNGQISGKSNGSVSVDSFPDKQLTLTGKATVSGTYTIQGHGVTLRQGTMTAEGGKQGLRLNLKLDTANGGSLLGTFISSAPLSLALPENGQLSADIKGIDLMLLKPWLPKGTRIAGRISGRARGELIPGQSFELDGKAELSKGMVHRQGPAGSLDIAFKSATASWKWRKKTLSGNLSLVMENYGHAKAEFQLPIAASFPLTVIDKGPVVASFSGKFREKGILSSLFPSFVNESSGEIETGLAVNGTWTAPQITGKLQVAKAGAYLPQTGIQVKNVQLTANLENNRIRIEKFRAESGDGNVEGNASLTLDKGKVVSYQGAIDGKNFLAVNFPELRILSTPKLTFSGTPQKFSLRGEILLPELSVDYAPSRTLITPSSDVILEGKALPVTPASAFDLDIKVRVRLGERAFVKIEGINAQLGGAVDLSMHSLDRITSTGEIKVVKGRYRSYGVDLDIVRGRLFFAGSKLDNPTLDFLALRTVGNVQAGVTVTGTLQQPITKLYSDPSMQDGDTLAYIVLGHPLGSSGEHASLLDKAAGTLLTSDKAKDLQNQIKNQLGLSTFEIQGGVGGSTDYMGYKPLQVTPPGEIPSTQQPGKTQTILTVGKFLTPQLYISYGRSLFTSSNLFRLRYDISRKWQIETQTGGGESGADLYYKIEFK